MKVNLTKASIAICVSFLINYGIYLSAVSNITTLLIGGTIFITTTLLFSFAVSFDHHRTTINIRLVSSVFLLLAIISNSLFCFFIFSVPYYVIPNGLMYLAYAYIIYTIYDTKH